MKRYPEIRPLEQVVNDILSRDQQHAVSVKTEHFR
jgi:hypothetical protein